MIGRCKVRMFGNRAKNGWHVIKKTLIISSLFAAISAIFGAMHSLLVFGQVALQSMINASYIAGSFVIAASLTVLLFPASLKGQGLIDHTNYAELTMKAREKKRALAYGILYVGFGIFSIAAAAELLTSTL